MSAANPPGNGAPEPSPGGAPGQASGGGAPPSSDYLARVAREPDFARAEVSKHQSRADKAESELRHLGRLREVVGQVGGDQLYQVLEEYQSVLAEPRLRDAIQSFRSTGRIELNPPTPPETPRSNGNGTIDEDLLTPFERQMVSFMKDTSSRLEKIDGRVQTHEVSAGQTALTRHLEQFFQELPLSTPIVEKVKQSMQANVRRYTSQGEEGRKALDNLLSPTGYQTVKALAMSSLSWDEVEEAIGRRRQNLRGGLRTLATDGPPRGAAGRELPDLKGMTAQQAIEFARANPDLIGSE